MTTTTPLGPSAAEQGEPSGWQRAARVLLVAAAYYATARLGLLIPYVGTHVSLIWLPTGVALAAYLRWGGTMAPAAATAAFLANLGIGSPPWIAAAIAVGNALGPWLSAMLLRRWGFDAALVKRRDLGVFLAAVMLGMTVTATNGTAWLVSAGLLPTEIWHSAWTSWWLGDSVGALLGGVPLVALNARTLHEAFLGTRGPVNLGLLAGAAGCGTLAFSGAVAPGSALQLPLLALPFFLSSVLALRSGALAASLAALLIAAVAAWGTSRGAGPFAGFDAHAGLLALWSYVSAQACTSLLIWVIGAELLSSRRQLEALLMHAGEGVVMLGPDQCVRALNPAAQRILGIVDTATVRGKPLDSLPHGFGPALAAWLGAWRAAGTEHAPHDLLLPRPEGSPMALELQAAHHPDAGGQWHTHLVMRDVSARRDAEARIARGERQLRAIADHMPALICYLDREHRYRFANATYRDWFGVEPDELIGKRVDEMFPPELYELRRPYMERALADGQLLSYEMEVTVAGCQRHLRSTYVPDRAADGSVQGLYVLILDITELKLVQLTLSRMVRFDHLTGLLNRQPFEERLEEAVRGAQRGQGALAVLFIDVDSFKSINDSRGHATGDAVLKEFARRLQRAVRGSDTVARLAGDEFVVLLERVRGPGQAEAVAAKVCAEMQPPFQLDDGELSVSASVGVAWSDGGQTMSAASAMAAADAALYEAKRAGRNTWRVHHCEA